MADVIGWLENAEAVAKQLVVFQEKPKIFIGSNHFFKRRLIAPAPLYCVGMD